MMTEIKSCWRCNFAVTEAPGKQTTSSLSYLHSVTSIHKRHDRMSCSYQVVAHHVRVTAASLHTAASCRPRIKKNFLTCEEASKLSLGLTKYHATKTYELN
jgi:hypothetical protein